MLTRIRFASGGSRRHRNSACRFRRIYDGGRLCCHWLHHAILSGIRDLRAEQSLVGTSGYDGCDDGRRPRICSKWESECRCLNAGSSSLCGPKNCSISISTTTRLIRSPKEQKEILETQIFQKPLTTVWDETVAFFSARDPEQLDKAAEDPKRKMALIFRWYLGQSSHWAKAGVLERKSDYQIWCSPRDGRF